MKKIAAAALVCVLCLSLTGCMGGSDTEISNRVVIQGIGIDIAENDEYVITLQALDLARAGSSGAESKGNLTKIYQVTGRSVSDAIRNSTRFVGRKPMYSHNRIIIFGEEVARRGLDRVMDFFVRDYATRASVNIAVARKGKAEDILRAEFGDSSIPAEEIERLLESGVLNAKTTEMEIAQAINLLEEENSDLYVPALSLAEDTPIESKSAMIDGMAIFHNDVMADYLDEEQTRGLLWINGKVKQGKLVLEDEPYGQVSLSLIKSKSHVETSVEHDQPHYRIRIECVCDVNEVENVTLEEFEKDKINDVARMVERQIVESVERALSVCMEQKCDVFRLNRHLMLENPSYYKTHAGHWRDELPEITTEATAKVTIRRLGQETVHLFD